MIKGLYSAASAMIAGLNRQNILSHNIANLETPGFKQIMTSLDDYLQTQVITTKPKDAANPLPTAVYDMLGVSRTRWVGNLGLGVQTTPETTDFNTGSLYSTDQPLDLAIQGSGFFRIQTPNGEHYTRDGRFTRDSAGTLVTVDGYKVLGVNGQPITLPDGEINVTPDGTIYVNNQQIARIGIVTFTNPETELVRDMPNMFISTGTPLTTGVGTIEQGFLEAANVDTAQVTTQMIEIARFYEAAKQMVSVQDELLGRAISILGRF
jgi:flagellar basal-body rod protein FlgF